MLKLYQLTYLLLPSVICCGYNENVLTRSPFKVRFVVPAFQKEPPSLGSSVIGSLNYRILRPQGHASWGGQLIFSSEIKCKWKGQAVLAQTEENLNRYI